MVKRFPIVLGEDDYTGRLTFHVKHILNNQPLYFPNIDAQISFIQSSDAAAFLNFLFDNEITGPVNCCSPEPISLRAFVEVIQSVTGMQSRWTNAGGGIEHSPFGIESDWYMDAALANKYGFSAASIDQWLPTLIDSCANKLKKRHESFDVAEKVRAKIYSEMSFARKWEEVCRLRETAWKLKAAGLRTRHPNWSERQVQAEVRRIFLYATT